MKYAIIAFCLCFGLTTTALPFDEKREGFIIGGGLGPALTSWSQTIGSITSNPQNDFNINTDFRIGGGFKGEQSMFYYWNRISWLSMVNVYGDKVIITSGITGLGLSYYFKPFTPSFYLLGCLGLSFWGTPFEPNSKTWLGVGLIGGVGYEFIKHLSVEVTTMWGNPSISELGTRITTDALTVAVTVIGIAY